MADLSITGSSFLASTAAKKEIGIAGVAITIGQLLYFDSASSTWKLADGNVLAASYCTAIAGSSAGIGQQVIVITEDPDLTPGATLSLVDPIYVVSATAGGIAASADLNAGGIYPLPVLTATSTTKGIFKPGSRGTALTVAA